MSPTFKKVVLWGSVTYAVLLAVFVLTGAVSQQPSSASADSQYFISAGEVAGWSTARAATASATDPNSYLTTDPNTGWSIKGLSLARIAILKSRINPNIYVARMWYSDNVGNGYNAPGLTSYSFRWVKDASNRVTGLHAVFYYSAAGQMITLDVGPGTNPITHEATNVITFKSTSYSGRIVLTNVVSYLNPDKATVTYRP